MSTADPQTDGQLAQNIIYFARALRRAGMPVGTEQVHTGIKAAATVGFTRRVDFYVTLRAVFVTRVEDLALFTQTFNIFWRDPGFIETMMQALMPMLEKDTPAAKPKPADRRAQEALMADKPGRAPPPRPREEVEIDSRFSFSDLEKLGAQDFAQMSAEELRLAEKAISTLALPIRPRITRRYAPAPRGRLDARAALRRARRVGGEVLALPKRAPVTRPPRVVLLVDISGSMATYSRMMLHFAHALRTARRTVVSELQVFTFGTRLTNISQKLISKDPDRALHDIGQAVQDWDGGTAIGENIDRFLKAWGGRVLAGGASVVLITDGLERGDPQGLGRAAERLQRRCEQLIWMNPLLRYDAFAPTASGIAALLPHVDRFIGAQNLDSMADLMACLSGDGSADKREIR